MTSQIPGGRSIHLSYEELKESEANYTKLIFDTRPAYCILTSNFSYSSNIGTISSMNSNLSILLNCSLLRYG